MTDDQGGPRKKIKHIGSIFFKTTSSRELTAMGGYFLIRKQFNSISALSSPSLSTTSLTVSAYLACLTGPATNAIVKLHTVQMLLGTLSASAALFSSNLLTHPSCLTSCKSAPNDTLAA